MFFAALATDYDGTLAKAGLVHSDHMAELERLRRSGRRAILVTGRQLDDLQSVCPRLDLFDRSSRKMELCCFVQPRKKPFCSATGRRRNSSRRLLLGMSRRFAVGEIIVVTWEPQQQAVLEAIKQCGLELKIIFDKGAEMVLPPGANKASGAHRRPLVVWPLISPLAGWPFSMRITPIARCRRSPTI
jgi:hydroxymethylpyrimidine pyrophosphatase-like HAD family hydrolase